MIAYGTGKAGQFAKGLADRHFRTMYGRTILVVYLLGTMGGGIAGIGFVPLVLRYIPSIRQVPLLTYSGLFAVAATVAAVSAWYLYGRLARTLDRVARLRVAALSGGQAEALVAFTLGRLDDDWHLFNGVAMKGGGDVDHVLVGPGGVFAVSTKSSRGIYAVEGDGRLTLNGGPCDHAADAQARAMKLRNWLEALLQADPAVRSIPFVRAVLVNPFALLPVKKECGHAWLMEPRQLFEHACNAGRPLRRADVAGCVAALTRLTGWAAMPAKVAPALGTANH